MTDEVPIPGLAWDRLRRSSKEGLFVFCLMTLGLKGRLKINICLLMTFEGEEVRWKGDIPFSK